MLTKRSLRSRRPVQSAGMWLEPLESRVLFALDLTGYTLTFQDEFNLTSVSVSDQSPKGASTYYSRPPYGPGGNYSASQWDVAAISAGGGVMQLSAFQDGGGNWHSGNISSMDAAGNGFAQTYGYWEVRAKMPSSGTGSWPAFWLMSKNSILNNLNATNLPNEEIDIFEWYGTTYSSNPQQAVMQQASHNWTPQPDTAEHVYNPQTPMPGGAFPWQGFHNYGVQVDPAKVTFYIDGVQTNQINTPTAYIQSPFYFMIDYALGGGWPLSGVVNNSHMDVDYVRVYALPSVGATPAAPMGLLATTIAHNRIDLTWSDNSLNETGFEIERATNSTFTNGLTLLTTTAANATSYSSTGLSAGTQYYYRVRATNGSGDSANSPSSSATTLAAPVNNTIANGSFEAPTLRANAYTYTPSGSSWTFAGQAGIQTNGSAYGATNAPNGTQTGLLQGISGQTLGSMSQTINFTGGTYTLSFQGARRGSNLQPVKILVDGVQVGGTITPTSSSFATYTSANFTVGAGNHTIRLEATDATGDKTTFVDLVAINAVGATIPAAPSGLTATAVSTSQINLTWADNSNNETGFKVERATNSAFTTGLTLLTTTAAGATSYSSTGLAAATTYYYRVRATNSAGDSANSNTASATTQSTVTVPTAPTAISATATSSSQINVSWTDNSNNETGFEVDRATNSTFTANLVSSTTTANTVTFASTGLAASTTYYYRIRSTNSAGDSANSATLSATTQAAGTVPGQVTGLTATAASSSQINLSWTAVSGATSYNIYRSTTSNGQGTTPIVTGVTGTTYPNTGLSASTTYYYKVAAVNGAGTGTQSAQASATTQASGTNVLLNPSFETPALNNNYVLRPTNADWTFTGNAGIQENGSAYSGSTSPAPGGTQTAFLQGNGSNGAMSQAATLTAGSHTLTFYAAQRWSTVQPIKVTVDGVQIGSTITPAAGGGYTQYSITFSVTAGSHTIKLEATDATGDKTTFIDLVSLV